MPLFLNKMRSNKQPFYNSFIYQYITNKFMQINISSKQFTIYTAFHCSTIIYLTKLYVDNYGILNFTVLIRIRMYILAFNPIIEFYIFL